jgi:hypothetical protein
MKIRVKYTSKNIGQDKNTLNENRTCLKSFEDFLSESRFPKNSVVMA